MLYLDIINRMKKNSKFLTKNIGLLSLSQFGSSFLSFFLVPLYTSILSTADYGTFDLISTTVALLIPLVTFNIGEGIIVFALKKNNQRDVFSIAIKYALIGTILVFAISVLNLHLKIIESLVELWYFLPILFFVSVLNLDLIYFLRAIERFKDTAVSGVLCSFVIISLNILFLVFFKWGIIGYFLAFILGYLTQIVFLVIKGEVWNFFIQSKDLQLEQEMLKYSRPLIFNSLSWWINSFSDRFVIIAFAGVAANGIYSIGYKIPSILNIFQSIFSSAWSVSAVKEFDIDDKDGFFSNTYAMYNCGLTLVCSVIVAMSRFLAYILYSKDFFIAWQYSTFLTISIIFGALSGFLGGIFSAQKCTGFMAFSTIAGAITNIGLNILLVFFIGPIGAAISTLVSYFVIWILRLKEVGKYIKIRINVLRDCFSYFLLVIQTIMLFCLSDSFQLYLAEIIIIFVLVFLYRQELKKSKNIINEILEEKL